MGRLDNVRRIIREDFDNEYNTLIGKLSFVLNTFMEQVVAQMNGNIDFTNLNQEILTYRVKVNDDFEPIGNNLLKTDILSSRGISVINITTSDTDVIPLPFISYSQNEKIIKIKNVAGLKPDVFYTLTMIVYGR